MCAGEHWGWGEHRHTRRRGPGGAQEEETRTQEPSVLATGPSCTCYVRGKVAIPTMTDRGLVACFGTIKRPGNYCCCFCYGCPALMRLDVCLNSSCFGAYRIC